MNKSYFICASFLLLFLPSEVFAPENDDTERFEKVVWDKLSPLGDDSEYIKEFVAVTKNHHGGLVSVIFGHVYAYLPHPILDDYLNQFPIDYVTIDDVNYKKWSGWIWKCHSEEKAIHGSELMADWCTWLIKNVETKGNFFNLPPGFSCKPIDDVVVIIRADHASLVVEKDDITDYYFTVLKPLD